MSSRRFDLVELLAIVAFVSFTVALVVYFAPARKTEVRGRQRILDYFTAHGYVLQTRYLDADQFNFYFIPLATPASAPGGSR